MTSFLGHSRLSFYHHPKPIALIRESGEPTDLVEACKSVTPECYLNPFLFNGHLQTIWTVTSKEGPPIIYRRKIFESDDTRYPGQFAVDFVAHKPSERVDDSLPPRTNYFTDAEWQQLQQNNDSRPMLVTLHGLSGGSQEVYLRHVIAPLVSDDGGWEACVVNARGCSYSKVTSGVLYNARATWDLRQIIKWLRKTFPNRPLFGVGYSLGANIMANVCGTENCHNVRRITIVVPRGRRP